MRRDRENQGMSEGSQACEADLDPIRGSPYGPAASDTTGCTNRPGRRQHLTTGAEPSKKCLRHRGRPWTDMREYRTGPPPTRSESAPARPLRGHPDTEFGTPSVPRPDRAPSGPPVAVAAWAGVWFQTPRRPRRRGRSRPWIPAGRRTDRCPGHRRTYRAAPQPTRRIATRRPIQPPAPTATAGRTWAVASGRRACPAHQTAMGVGDAHPACHVTS